MKHILILSAFIIATQAHAADYAVVLSDGEKAALIEIIDEAVKAKGLLLARNGFLLADKIKAAPVVTERKEDK